MAAFASIEKQAAKFGAAVLRGERSTTQAIVRETAKQHDAHVKAHNKAMQAEAKAAAKSVQEAKKTADKKIAEMNRAANLGVKAEERAAKESERIAERHAQANLRIRQKHFRDVQRAEEAAAKQSARIEEAAARSASQSRRNIARTIGGSVASNTGKVLGGVAAVAGGLLAVGGGFSAVDAVQTGISNRGKAADIAIASNGALSKQDVYGRAANAATAYGTSTEKALSAVDRFYAKSGDAKKSLEIMPEMLALATATGGDAGEISEAAGQVSNADKSLTSKQIADVARGWGGQGRAGSVDMRELASFGSRIASGAALFAGDKAANMVSLGGIVQQSTAGGAASAAEATESVARLASDAYKHKDALKRMGVQATDSTGKLIGPEDLIKKSVIAAKGDRSKLQDIYGEMSIKAVGGYANTYNDARIASLKGGASAKDSEKAGEAAMNAAFKTWQDAALTEKQVKEDAATRLAETDKKLEAAMNDLREAVAEKLLPKLPGLITKLTELTPKLADLLTQVIAVAEWMGKNPFKSIILLIAGAVAKDVAMAGIGKIIASAIANAAGGRSAGGAIAGGGNAAGGFGRNLAAAGAIGAVAVAVGSAGIAAIDASFAATDQSHAKTFASEMAALNGASEAGGIKGTDAKSLAKKKAALEAAQKAAGETVNRKKKEQEDYNGTFSLQRDLGQITSFFGSDAAEVKDKAEKASIERSKKEFDELTEKLKSVNAALDLMSKNASNADLGKPKAGQPLSSPDRSKG